MATLTPLDTARATAWFHALSDETRLEIVRLLGRGERCVCELTDAMDAAQSRLSFHLKVLKTAGLVTDRREGRWVYYALNPDAFDGAAAAVAVLRPSEDSGRTGEACCG
jgi:ArsR family transcriptional regulator